MNKYQEQKEKAREIAIEWQHNDSDFPYTWGGYAILCDYFYKLGKRYGLIKEFRENSIPC